MPYPTKDEFAKLICNADIDDVVQQHVFGGVPFVYRNSPGFADLLFTHLSDRLGVERANMTVVGSGKVGISLSPDTFGNPFHADSDIDVVIVSESLFDKCWLELLRFPRFKFRQLSETARSRIDDHISEIYWGRIWPHQLLSVSDLARQWISAFRSIAQIPQLAYHEVNGRLYRTWDHAKVYHTRSLRKIARRLRS